MNTHPLAQGHYIIERHETWQAAMDRALAHAERSRGSNRRFAVRRRHSVALAPWAIVRSRTAVSTAA